MNPMMVKMTPNPKAHRVRAPKIMKAFEAPDLRRMTVIAPPQRGQVLEARRSMLVCVTTDEANGDWVIGTQVLLPERLRHQ